MRNWRLIPVNIYIRVYRVKPLRFLTNDLKQNLNKADEVKDRINIEGATICDTLRINSISCLSTEVTL